MLGKWHVYGILKWKAWQNKLCFCQNLYFYAAKRKFHIFLSCSYSAGTVSIGKSAKFGANSAKNHQHRGNERRVMKVWSGNYNFGPNVVYYYYFLVYEIYNCKKYRCVVIIGFQKNCLRAKINTGGSTTTTTNNYDNRVPGAAGGSRKLVSSNPITTHSGTGEKETQQ